MMRTPVSVPNRLKATARDQLLAAQWGHHAKMVASSSGFPALVTAAPRSFETAKLGSLGMGPAPTLSSVLAGTWVTNRVTLTGAGSEPSLRDAATAEPAMTRHSAPQTANSRDTWPPKAIESGPRRR